MRALTPLFLLLAACPDQGLTINNTAPEVAFISPSEGTTFAVGADVVLRARVSDPQNSLDQLTLLWSTDRVTTLVGGTTSEEDVVTYTVGGGTFPSGEHLVTLTALDPFNASSSDTVRIIVAENSPPTVTLALPTPGAVLRGGEPITVRAVLEDPDEARITDLIVQWEGTGLDGLPEHPDGSGVAAGSWTPTTFGDATLSVLVFDSVGGSASASVTVTLFNPDDDSDQDGYRDVDAGGDDCDDDNPNIHPGMPEVCDGVDQDCNDLIDDNATDADEWHLATDLDGYGASGPPTLSCSQPDEATANNDDDCDDTNREVHPGATEIPYNGVDDDCVGGDLCDVDLDGYPAMLGSCNGTDCDDNNGDVHPGGTDIPYN